MFSKFFGSFFTQEEEQKIEKDKQIPQNKPKDKNIQKNNNILNGQGANNDNYKGIENKNGQNQILRRKMSIIEQQQMNQTFRIYENDFSDFLIMYDTKLEIKTLQEKDWSEIVQKKSIEGVSPERIQFSLLKGIPYDIYQNKHQTQYFIRRKDVWLILSRVEELKKEYKFNFDHMCRVESPSDKIIVKDLNRTFAELQFFSEQNKHDKKYEGREKLFRVLRAYSHLDKEIGYTQGMNFIAASLLVHMNPDNEKEIEVCIINKEYEENVFWILVHIMKDKNWRVLFLDGTPGIHMMINILENKMKEFTPQIYKRIKDVGKMMEFCRKGILEECHKIFKEEKKKGDIEFGDFRFNIASIIELDLLSSH